MKKILISSLSLAIIASASTAMAGKGYFVTINNLSDSVVTTVVNDAKCMYETNNLTTIVNPHSSVGPLYVEEKASGGCYFNSSKFKFHIEKQLNGQVVASADIPFEAVKIGSDPRIILASKWGVSTNMDMAYVADYKPGKQDYVKINVNY